MPMPVEKGMFKICQKSGRIVGFSSSWRALNWFLPLTVLAAAIWWLVRVLPKPSRAAYPCQRVAMPIALGGLSYFLSLLGAFAALGQARKLVRKNRFAVAAACLAAGLACAAVVVEKNSGSVRAAEAMSQDATNGVAATVTPNAPIGIARGINPGRVVWSYDPAACFWSGSQDGTHWWDSNRVNQARVDAMLSSALRGLTSATNDAAAWDALFRSFNQRRGNGNIGYAESPRKAIAIKINQNPCNTLNTDCYVLNGVTNAGNNEYSITGNPHLILALVKQLVAVQVAQTNIVVLDASGLNRGWGGPRTIGDNIYQYIHPLYPGVRFVDGVGKQGRELATWPSTNNVVYPTNVTGETTSRGLMICKQITDAGFFINMAILKDHDDGPTLCGKNNYGSISGQRHGPMYGNKTPAYYSNLIPLMGHQELGEKTLLYMIDALYGAASPNVMPTKWKITPFNTNWPNSVFLSQDGVAIDSVGFDFLNAEWGQTQNTDYYLQEAAYEPGTNGVKLSGVAYRPTAGTNLFVRSLGTAEHWNNSTNKQYSRNLGTGAGIELLKLDVSAGFGVALVTPPSGSSFPSGSNIVLQAQVDNATNSITQVAFYRGTNLLGAASASPYALTWTNAPVGAWSLTAVATDSASLSRTSSPMLVSIVSSGFVGTAWWDANPVASGAQDGGGIWNLTASNWWTGAGNMAWNAAVVSNTVFGCAGGAAGTVTLGNASIAVSNLTFNPASSGDYTIASGGFTLGLAGTPTINVASNCAPVLAAPLTGAGFTKAGGGRLTLSGSNAYSGAGAVNAGTLVLSGDNSGTAASCAVSSGATLRLSHTNAVKGTLTMQSGATLHLRADADATFAPAAITLENAPDILNINVAPSVGSATGKTLRLAGTLAFANSSDQTINVIASNKYTLALGNITATAGSHSPYFRVNLNVVSGVSAVIDSFTSGNWGNYLNFDGGGRVTVTGSVANGSNGSAILFVNGGTTATLQGPSVKTGTGDAYRYFVPNGTLVVDHRDALTNNTTGAGLKQSLFILGAATNIGGAGFSAPNGFLIASNNAHNCAVYLGDASYPNGGLTMGATVTNYVSDGDVGFTNSGTMAIGGQNTSGTNTYANPIILGWTPNRGKSVTLVAAARGVVDFAGGILQNGADTGAGVTIGDATHTGTVRFSAANTYPGPTLVGAGTLDLNGSLAGTGAVTVAAGATLGGTGTINGAVTSSGIVAPGAPGVIGALTINNNYTQASNGVLSIRLASAPDADALLVAGTATLGGTLRVTLVNGYTPQLNETMQIVSAGTAMNTSFTATNLPPLGSGLVWRVLTTGNVVRLEVAPALTGYAAWAAAITNGLTNVDQCATGDGYPNLLKYATGSSPTTCDTIAHMGAAFAGGLLALQFHRNVSATDVTLIVEGAYTAANDATWNGLATNTAGSWGGATNVIEDTNVTPAVATAWDSEATATSRFLRLRVTKP